MIEHRTITTKGHRNAKDGGCLSAIGTMSDAHLYSGQSKGQSIVLAFSTPRGLTHPQLGHGNVIVTEMIWLDWAQYDRGKRLPSMEFSMRFRATWPFSDSLNVRCLPLRVKRDVPAVSLSSKAALVNAARKAFFIPVRWMLGRIRRLTFIHIPAFQVLRVVFSPTSTLAVF